MGAMSGRMIQRGWLLGWLLMLVMGLGSLMGQEAGSAEVEFRAKNIKTLESLTGVMAETEKAITEKKAAKKKAATEEEAAELTREIDKLRERLTGLQDEFAKLATGVGEAEYEGLGESVSNLSEELEQMGRLLVGEFNEATAGAREMEEMRSMQETLLEREDLAERALARLTALEGEDVQGVLKERLDKMREEWEGRLTQVVSQREALALRIQRREAENIPVVERLWAMVGKFCTQRGRNLLVALLAFLGTTVVMRFLRHLLVRYGPLRRSKKSGFFVRVLDVVYGLISVVIALLAAFGVMYAAGDWLLLSLGLIFVVGLAWAMKSTLPAVYEQVKLVLNLGPVREGERFVYDGLPWKVKTLGFYCEFINPELTGAVLRLPIRSLIDEHSRPYVEKEPWFPTAVGDWLLLSDGTYGKVVSQTPEQVVVLKLGGSRAFYQTAAFLGLNPENLSRNFRINVTFGIDYGHQAEVTTTIREAFERRLTEELRGCAGGDGLISLKVEFSEAGPSSLDFDVLADFSGELASRYNFLRRSIQRICVDVCNENGWVIPFTQITVHQAK